MAEALAHGLKRRRPLATRCWCCARATRWPRSCATSAPCTSSSRSRTAGSARGCCTPVRRTPGWHRRLRASTATVTRVAHWLNHGEGGYRLVLERLAERGDEPAVPPRPCPRRAACTSPPCGWRVTAGDRGRGRRPRPLPRTARSGTSRCCSRAPTTSRSGRTDGAVEAAVAGRNQLIESGSACRGAAAAGLRPLPRWSWRCADALVGERAGRPGRLPSGHRLPVDDRRLLRRSRASTCRWSRSTARSSWRRGWTPPRPIVDLVSTGETLRQNGLRPIETMLESEAVLLVRPGLDERQQAIARVAGDRDGERDRRPRQALPDAERAGQRAAER